MKVRGPYEGDELAVHMWAIIGYRKGPGLSFTIKGLKNWCLPPIAGKGSNHVFKTFYYALSFYYADKYFNTSVLCLIFELVHCSFKTPTTCFDLYHHACLIMSSLRHYYYPLHRFNNLVQSEPNFCLGISHTTIQYNFIQQFTGSKHKSKGGLPIYKVSRFIWISQGPYGHVTT